MARGAVFTGVWARCPNHTKTLLKPDEEMCMVCKIVERNLSLIPPFDVFCIEDIPVTLEKEKVYTVKWVILEGRNTLTSVKGYVLEAEEDNVFPYIVSAENFIPLKYLTKNQEDAWLVDA